MKKLILILALLGSIILAAVNVLPSQADDAVYRTYSYTMQSAAAATGNGTAADVGGLSVLAANVSGTFSATITWEGSVDGSTYTSILAVNAATGAQATTATTTGTFLLNAAGLSKIRARVSTWVSGTVTVTGRGCVARVNPVLYGIAGPSGPTGATGATGATGSTGAAGADGAGGMSFTIPCGQGDLEAWAEDNGTWSVSSSTAAWRGGYFGNFGTHADTDAISVQIRVPVTGTWTAYVLEATGSNHAKYNLKIDGTSKALLDQYAASGVDNAWSSAVSLGTLTAGTSYTLALVANGKNASSSDYYLTFQSILMAK